MQNAASQPTRRMLLERSGRVGDPGLSAGGAGCRTGRESYGRTCRLRCRQLVGGVAKGSRSGAGLAAGSHSPAELRPDRRSGDPSRTRSGPPAAGGGEKVSPWPIGCASRSPNEWTGSRGRPTVPGETEDACARSDSARRERTPRRCGVGLGLLGERAVPLLVVKPKTQIDSGSAARQPALKRRDSSSTTVRRPGSSARFSYSKGSSSRS